MPKRYFSKAIFDKHYSYHHYDETPEGILEDRVYRVLRSIFSIPRRFFKKVLRTLKP